MMSKIDELPKNSQGATQKHHQVELLEDGELFTKTFWVILGTANIWFVSEVASVFKS